MTDKAFQSCLNGNGTGDGKRTCTGTGNNGRVSDKQAHNSTHYRRQLSFMYWLCSKQNCLLCDFGGNYIITIVKTGLTSCKY
jgi:hypothetical protein